MEPRSNDEWMKVIAGRTRKTLKVETKEELTERKGWENGGPLGCGTWRTRETCERQRDVKRSGSTLNVSLD